MHNITRVYYELVHYELASTLCIVCYVLLLSTSSQYAYSSVASSTCMYVCMYYESLTSTRLLCMIRVVLYIIIIRVVYQILRARIRARNILLDLYESVYSSQYIIILYDSQYAYDSYNIAYELVGTINNYQIDILPVQVCVLDECRSVNNCWQCKMNQYHNAPRIFCGQYGLFAPLPAKQKWPST